MNGPTNWWAQRCKERRKPTLWDRFKVAALARPTIVELTQCIRTAGHDGDHQDTGGRAFGASGHARGPWRAVADMYSGRRHSVTDSIDSPQPPLT